MARNRFLPLALLAGVVAAFPQSTTQPPNRSRNSSQNTVGVPARTPTGVPSTTVPGTRPNRTTNRREPCWEVAGVSKAAMQQRRALAQQFHQEVEAVCANASLTPAQKQERIREIQQQERQQMQGLITPQQEEAMRVCRQQRGGGAHAGGGTGGHGGPCGTLPGIVNRQNESDWNDEPPEK